VCRRGRRRSIDAEWTSNGIEGDTAGSHPYSERRLILEDLNGPRWRTPQAFDDGEAPWNAVCAHELEGWSGSAVAAVCRRGRLDQETNRDYWRYEMERAGALKHRRERQFV
jgi:hypothetical protein